MLNNASLSSEKSPVDPSISKRHIKPLISLSLIAIILGGVGGEPYQHPDSIVSQVINALQENGDPINFKYPGGIVIYPNVILYAIFYLFLRIFNIVDSTTAFKRLVKTDTDIFTLAFINIDPSLPGHITTLLFSVVGVIFTYLTAFRLVGKINIAFLAGLFLSTSLLWVVNSHYMTVDIPMAALAIATIYFSLLWIEEKKALQLPSLIIIGALWGLTTSAKWTGAVIGSSIIVPMFFAYRGYYLRAIKDLLILSVAAASSFLLTNPYIILNFKTFLSQFVSLVQDAETGWYGHTVENGFIFYLTHTLYLAYGIPLLLLAGVGIINILMTKNSLTNKLVLFVFPVVFFVLIGKSNMAFHRYILPIFPLLAIYSAVGCCYLSKLIQEKFKIQFLWILTVLATLSILANISYAIKHNLVMRSPDTRQELIAIINDVGQLKQAPINIYAGGYLGYSSQSPLKTANLRTNQLISVPAGRTSDNIVKALNRAIAQYNELDLLFFDSFSHDPLVYDSDELGVTKMTRPQLFKVLQINPFSVPKNNTRYSIESSYSPFLPDLKYRNQPGPYIEIYIKDTSLAEKLLKACQKNFYNCHLLSGDEGYYFQKLLS